MGLEEMSMSEAMSIDGGFAWGVFLVCVAIGLLISCPTAANETNDEESTPEVDAVTGA